MRRFASLSLRARLLLIGTTGVALALAAGGLGLYAALTYAVNRTLDAEALASAAEVARLVDAQELPDPVPVSGAQVIQVIDAQGRVVGGSVSADRLTPLLRPPELAEALQGTPVMVSGARIGATGPLRVSAVRAGPAADPQAVVVALPVGDVLATRDTLRTALLVSYPLLLLALAAIAWRVIGWALQPVEALRLGAERISGTARPERLPVPPATDEIHALAVTLNGMLDRLAAARARQRSFVADAAHELRSPLASMRTQLEVADRLGEGGGLPADLIADVDRLSALVEDLLLLARGDASARGPAAFQVFDGRALLAELTAGYADARVPVTLTAGEPVPITADPTEVRRAVANLVDNAVRHARSAVQLDVRAEADGVVVTVEDDGPGIPIEDRERVFERFTRLDDARARDAGGSGLGLAIARELVERAGGTVRFVPSRTGCLQAEVRLPGAAARTAH